MQEDRRRAERKSLIAFPFEDRFGDRVHQFLVPVQQVSAVDDAQKLRSAEHGIRRDHRQPPCLDYALCRPGVRRGLQRQQSALGQVRILAGKVLRIQQHQSGNRFAPQGPADGRVVYQAVSDAAGTGRTDHDLALWTDEVEEIELEAPLDQLEALLEILQSFQLVAAGDIHNGSLERGHMNDGLQFVHPAAEERPCAPDVELHLLLGLGEDAVLEQAPSEQAEKPADQQNKQRKDLQEFRFQHANTPPMPHFRAPVQLPERRMGQEPGSSHRSCASQSHQNSVRVGLKTLGAPLTIKAMRTRSGEPLAILSALP